jgi:hypothetical protein
MKKIFIFLLLVIFSIGLYAQVNTQQDIVNLKKQVNAVKYDNNKIKKQVTESTTNLNTKVVTIEKLLQNTDSSIKSQTTTIIKNGSDIADLKNDTKTRFNHVFVFIWSILILLLIVLGFVILLQIKRNKTKKELLTKINEIKKSLDNYIIQTNDSIDIKISETKTALNEQFNSSQLILEKSINSNHKTTNDSILSINNFIKESQKSNVEQLDKIKKVLEDQESALDNTLRSEIIKNQIETNQRITSLMDEIEKLKTSQSISVKTPRTRKSPKKV